MCNGDAHNARKKRESLSKRLGATAKAISTRDGHRCVYCQRTAQESGSHLHLDHLKPKSRGGTDAPGNLVLSCRRCNSARQSLPLRSWERVAAAHGIRFSADKVRRQASKPLAVTARAMKAAVAAAVAEERKACAEVVMAFVKSETEESESRVGNGRLPHDHAAVVLSAVADVITRRGTSQGG